MTKKVCASDIPVYAGLDVGKDELVLALRHDGRTEDAGSFANDKAGIRALIKHLHSLKSPVFICMEATGAYYEQAARALSKAPGISVMVANPRTIKDYARAMNQRSKTDRVDARIIALYAEKAGFKTWKPPSEGNYQLRLISRRIDERVREKAAEKNRLHALRAAGEYPRCLKNDITTHINVLEQSIMRLRKEALAIIKADEILRLKYQRLLSIPGVGETTAVRVLAETCTLPDGMTARQWVAHAGLDPVHRESGTSIRTPARLSRAGNSRLRSALFFPAMVASRFDPHVRAFADRLMRKGKKKLQALAAVMRKLIHAVWGMFKTSTDFNGAVLFPEISQNP